MPESIPIRKCAPQQTGWPLKNSPESPFFATPKEDRMGFFDWDKFFDDYDDQTIKPGMPYTSVLGSTIPVKTVGTCPRCNTGMHMERNLWFCPHCRRQLTVEAPNSEYRSDDAGIELAWNLPSEFEVSYDMRSHSPQQAAGNRSGY